MRVFTLLLVAVAVTVSAGAQMTAFDGALRELCSDSDGSAHPKKVSLEQAIFDSDFGELEAVRLILFYEPSFAVPEGRGKIVARPTLMRADGTRRKLGKLGAVQNRVDGATLAERVLDEPLGAGDAVRWSFRFKKFRRLDAGACVLVGGVANLPPEECGPYPDPESSDYVLPYRPGQTSVISQANCGSGSHRGVVRHSYDFALPPGTEIVAARAGTVVGLVDEHPEGTGLVQHDNLVLLEHDDGTFTRYVHIARGGALVTVGQSVDRGEAIALSGNAGSTSGLPHLHFQAQSCPDRTICGTLPVTFRNTRAHPDGLELGQAYLARPD